MEQIVKEKMDKNKPESIKDYINYKQAKNNNSKTSLVELN